MFPSNSLWRYARTGLALAAVVLVCACSRVASTDLRQRFGTLHSGDTLSEVELKLQQPLATVVEQHEAFGFMYVEYRLDDSYSNYQMRFVAAPGHEAVLVNKSAFAHRR